MARASTTALEYVIESFLLARHDLSEKTKKDYRTDLLSFARWQNNAQLRDLTKANADRYISAKAKIGAKRPTPYAARLAAATLKSFATWLAEEGIWADDDGGSVLRNLKIPRVPKQGRPPFDDTELQTILTVAGSGPNGARDRAIVTTMVGCGGLRLKEAWSLVLGDINWRTKELTVRWTSSKGRETRVARLDEIAAAALDAYIHDYRPDGVDDHIFLTVSGAPFTYNGFANHLYRLFDKLKALGVPDGKPHRLRDTWATNGHRLGMSLFDLQREGGWRDLDMPRRYVADRPLSELKRMPTPLAGVLRRAS
jgi:integrase